MTASGGPPPSGPPPGGPYPPGPPPMGYPPGPPVVQKTVKPVIGGLLIVLGSLGYLAMGGVYVTAGNFFIGIPGIEGLTGILVICGVILLLLGIISLLGGILAMMRKAWGIGLLAGILTIPSLLGLIGLILVAISRDEF